MFMRVYTCGPSWVEMLTCIYEAWSSKLGHENLKLLREPINQLSIFDEYIHVDPDEDKAKKLMDAIYRKISPYVYRELAFASMAYEEDVLDNIFHVLILGFAYGPNVLEMMQYRDVARNYEIRKRVGNEAHHFREFLRFHQLGNVFVAHLEPKSRVVEYLGPCFQDRMPSENFIIVDDVHSEAVIHYANTPFYVQKLTEDELTKLMQTEQVNDGFTDLWKVFFDSVSIRERENEKCQNNLFPQWLRKHAVEFL